VTVEGHGCGSTTKSVRSLLEDAMYEAAPDMTSLTFEGLDEPVASGFVGIDKLLSGFPASQAAVGNEGMD
jgi:hypothetical protein